MPTDKYLDPAIDKNAMKEIKKDRKIFMDMIHRYKDSIIELDVPPSDNLVFSVSYGQDMAESRVVLLDFQ